MPTVSVPTFSVVVPTYNRADVIAAALDSVFAQTSTDYELIVVDDGSTDDTDAVLAPYRDRATVVRQARAGPASARNLGVEHAGGRYLVFLDSDDLLPAWALATYAQIVEADAPALIMSRVLKFSHPGDLAGLRPTQVSAGRHPDYLQAASARYPITIAVAVRRSLVVEAGGFETRLICSEDQDLFLRLGTAAGFVFVDAPHLYAYRQHGASTSRDTAALHHSLRFVLREERRGRYPGGRARRGERRIVLSRMLGFAVSRCLKAGDFAHGYDLYLRGLPLLSLTRGARDLLRLPLLPFRRRE